MAEEIRERNDRSARWMGWMALAAGVLGFFFAPFLLGAAAVILGLITVFSQANNLGWFAIGIGVLAMAVNGWGY